MAITRRTFLIGAGLAGGGLIIGVALHGGNPPIPGTVPGSFQPNAWLQITRDHRVIFQLHKAEMGQGVMTGLPLLMGEELDLDPARFDIAMAGVHPAFTNSLIGTQITGGSTSIASSWDSLRHAGAAARAMLIAAAAKRWRISADQCSTDNGEVINAVNGQRLGYGELADAAAAFSHVSYHLKARKDYRWIGTAYPRLDRVIKSTGAARFGMDVYLQDMKIAVIVRCPHFGGSVKSWEPNSVFSSEGVINAFVMHSGIAIVAESYWQARQAAGQLRVTWNKGPLAGLDSRKILAGQQRQLQSQDPHIAEKRGDVDTARQHAAKTLHARYSAPYTHHSPMEPQNATALYRQSDKGNRCEVWAPNQAPDICRALIVYYGDVDYDNAIVHTTLLGGGFGRRGYPDFVAEVVAVAKKLPDVPIKLVWSREDDMQHDFYRPSSLHDLEGGLDESGRAAYWRHTLVSPSILRGFAVDLMSVVLPTWVPATMARSLGKTAGNTFAGMDPTSVDGARIPYAIDNLSIGHIQYDPGVPVGFWRSVAFSYTVFAAECFLDELCHAAGADPLSFRLQHLDDAPRFRGVLQLAAEKANWGHAPEGISQGIAVAEPYHSFCAMVAEVSVNGGQFAVERIVAAVDCGLVVTPNIVRAQIESGIVYALTAALKAPVTFTDGKTVQSNFHDLPVLRIDEVPVMEVYIVDSDAEPTGIGEIGVPTVAPALGNALFAATGQRLRDLPLKLS